MVWTDKQIAENTRVWQREKRFHDYSFFHEELQHGDALSWYMLLRRANDVSRRSGEAMPLIPFPSPKQCETFIRVHGVGK
jgi:hypothetical protein